MKRILLLLAALLLATTTASAQAVLASTSLASAVTDTTGQQIVITSTTGWLASTTGQTYYALIDREAVLVRAVNTTSKVITVNRGALSTRPAAHISGAPIWTFPATGVQTYVPSGQCTRSALISVPLVVIGTPLQVAGGEVGSLWDCLGVTTAGQWVQTNGVTAGLPTLGSTVASATSVTPTGTYFKMSGTVNPVSTIVLPAGTAAGFCLLIEPTGAWVTDTAGNILIASTAVTGKTEEMCWNGAKWTPSY